MTHSLSFATFWAGKAMSGYEWACINSFLRHGYPFTVYTYQADLPLPPGITRGNARDITNEDNTRRFLIKNKPNLSHFSDLFRYELFARTEHIWVDADMLLLNHPKPLANDMLLAREDDTGLCGAIMRLPGNDDRLDELIRRTKQLRDKELAWGATGPRLLTEVFSRQSTLNVAQSATTFFPIHYNDSWKLLLPEHREECQGLCQHATTLHLWNDRLIKIGMWKKLLPPEGSFLHALLCLNGADAMFTDTYPEAVMQNMVQNWRIRCEGGDIGIGQWLRQAVPSARLTYRRRLSLPT